MVPVCLSPPATPQSTSTMIEREAPHPKPDQRSYPPPIHSLTFHPAPPQAMVAPSPPLSFPQVVARGRGNLCARSTLKAGVVRSLSFAAGNRSSSSSNCNNSTQIASGSLSLGSPARGGVPASHRDRRRCGRCCYLAGDGTGASACLVGQAQSRAFPEVYERAWTWYEHPTSPLFF